LVVPRPLRLAAHLEVRTRARLPDPRHARSQPILTRVLVHRLEPRVGLFLRCEERWEADTCRPDPHRRKRGRGLETDKARSDASSPPRPPLLFAARSGPRRSHGLDLVG